jgi:hypothetical protein
MLREMIIIALNIGYIIINIPTVDARVNPIGRNYLKNVQRSMVNNCNNRALIMTNNTEMFKCVVERRNGNCCEIVNSTEFMAIRDNCISNYHAEFGKGVMIAIAIWGIIIAICSIK